MKYILSYEEGNMIDFEQRYLTYMDDAELWYNKQNPQSTDVVYIPRNCRQQVSVLVWVFAAVKSHYDHRKSYKEIYLIEGCLFAV